MGIVSASDMFRFRPLSSSKKVLVDCLGWNDQVLRCISFLQAASSTSHALIPYKVCRSEEQT